MSIKIALVGNPNCGKTTLFNSLTKSKQKVGNWPGVTVEKKIGKLKIDENEIEVVDLPGLYSLNPFSPDEAVSSNFLAKSKIDLIINVVSVINLERSLYLTLQLIELNIPLIIIVSMTDLVKKNGDYFNLDKFSQIFQCDVFESSKNNTAINFKIVEYCYRKLKTNKFKPNILIYNEKLEHYLNNMSKILTSNNGFNKKLNNGRFKALYILEHYNEKTVDGLQLNLNCKNEVKFFLEETVKTLNSTPNEFLINSRYSFITNNLSKFYIKNEKVNKDQILTNKIDKILINKWLSIPIFLITITLVYFISIPLIGKPISDWLNDVVLNEYILNKFELLLENYSVSPWLIDLICNGIISGVGAVLIFIPQLFFLFFSLSFLEECGYMSRIAFITDKFLTKVGLCGQSLISFLVSSSCGVNGVLASKTIKSDRTRFSTLVTTTYVPCSAKIPIIISIGSFFQLNGWLIAPLAYIICFLAIFFTAFFLNKFKFITNQGNQIFMEIPPYQLPSFKNLFNDAVENIKSFILKAGSVVLLASVFIWITSNLGMENGTLKFVNINRSFLAKIGKLLAPIFIPLGFSNWQAATATISGLVAKENIVNTLEIISSISNPLNSLQLNKFNYIFNSGASAFSFLIFNLLCAPCVLAIASTYKQTMSLKLTIKIIAIQTITAYIFAMMIYLLFSLFKI